MVPIFALIGGLGFLYVLFIFVRTVRERHRVAHRLGLSRLQFQAWNAMRKEWILRCNRWPSVTENALLAAVAKEIGEEGSTEFLAGRMQLSEALAAWSRAEPAPEVVDRYIAASRIMTNHDQYPPGFAAAEPGVQRTAVLLFETFAAMRGAHPTMAQKQVIWNTLTKMSADWIAEVDQGKFHPAVVLGMLWRPGEIESAR